MRNARISSQQFICLLTIFNLIASLLFLPAPMAREAGPAAWLTVPVAMLEGAIPISIMLGILARRHPNLGFGEVMEHCLGKWLGRFGVGLLGAITLFLTSLIIRDVMDFASVALLPGTPILIIGALFATTAAYGAYAGSEVISRLSVLVLILAFLAFALMFAGLGKEIRWTRAMPLLGYGPDTLVRGAWPSSGWFAEFITLAPFVFQISKPQKALRAMLLGNALAAVLLMMLVEGAVLVFGSGLAQKFIYPTYAMARQVAIGQFLERLEIGLMTVWLTGMVIKAASTLWSATVCLGWAVGVSGKTWLTALTGAGAFWLTTLWQSEMAMIWFSSQVWTPVTLPFFWLLPMLLLAGSFWQQRRRKGVAA